MKSKWHNQSLLRNSVKYALATNQAEFDELLKYLKQQPEACLPNKEQALTHSFERPGKHKTPFVVVCLDITRKQPDEKYIATLIHESVHVWQEFCEYIGEEKPSAEFEAYSIEQIAYNLLMDYRRRIQDAHE